MRHAVVVGLLLLTGCTAASARGWLPRITVGARAIQRRTLAAGRAGDDRWSWQVAVTARFRLSRAAEAVELPRSPERGRAGQPPEGYVVCIEEALCAWERASVRRELEGSE